MLVLHSPWPLQAHHLLYKPDPAKRSVPLPPQALINIIKPPVRDPKGFLQQHILKDLEQLTKMLGHSADETISVVHLVLRRLLQEQHQLSGKSEERGRGGAGAGQRQGLGGDHTAQQQQKQARSLAGHSTRSQSELYLCCCWRE